MFLYFPGSFPSLSKLWLPCGTVEGKINPHIIQYRSRDIDAPSTLPDKWEPHKESSILFYFLIPSRCRVSGLKPQWAFALRHQGLNQKWETINTNPLWNRASNQCCDHKSRSNYLRSFAFIFHNREWINFSQLPTEDFSLDTQTLKHICSSFQHYLLNQLILFLSVRYFSIIVGQGNNKKPFLNSSFNSMCCFSVC